jgi:hypothetical protein
VNDNPGAVPTLVGIRSGRVHVTEDDETDSASLPMPWNVTVPGEDSDMPAFVLAVKEYAGLDVTPCTACTAPASVITGPTNRLDPVVFPHTARELATTAPTGCTLPPSNTEVPDASNHLTSVPPEVA